jgi:magnesium transporter
MSDSWFYHISQSGKLSRVATFEAALAAAMGEGFLWLNYCQPTREELSGLAGPLGLHPLSIEDCFDDNQIPKIENFPRNTFILFNAVDYVDGQLLMGEIDLFIGDNFVVTVSQRTSDNRRLLDGIEHIMEMDIESARNGPAFLLHVILDHSVSPTFTFSNGSTEGGDGETGLLWDKRVGAC